MGGISSGKTGVPWAAVLALCLLLLSPRCCSPCQGRKLLAGDEEGAGVICVDGGLVLRVPPPPTSAGEEEAVPRKFKAIPERFMRSVPSPGVGH
jgi:hypothetical protein